jgi:ferredoxin-NADP reductase
MKLEAEKNNSIELYFNLTRDEDNNSWKGKKGRIDQEYLKEKISDLTDKHFFLCGPTEFVKNMKQILLELGIDKTRIKQEAYG